MTKLKTYLTAVITATLLALLCLIPTFSSARASYASTVESYDKLYYFSDSPNANERLQGFIQSSLNEYDELLSLNNSTHNTESELIDLSAYNEETLPLYFSGDFVSDYYDLGNSFIIFELSEIKVNDAITSFLRDFFKYNKENYSCKIMFISDTDERWYSDREFLDYVDIHFNTDLFYDFMINIIYRAGDLNGSSFDNLTFIFDKSLNYGITENDPKDNLIISTFMIKPLVYFHQEELNINQPACISDIFKRYNVNLLFYTGAGKYYDPVYGKEYSIENYYDYADLELRLKTTDIKIVGTSRYGYYESQKFNIDTADFLNKLNILEAENYYYNPDNYIVTLNLGGKSYEYNTRSINLETQLDIIIHDFILGYDLFVYDNWTGLCVVTYKLISFSPDGWMNDYSEWWENLDNVVLDYYISNLSW